MEARGNPTVTADMAFCNSRATHDASALVLRLGLA